MEMIDVLKKLQEIAETRPELVKDAVNNVERTNPAEIKTDEGGMSDIHIGAQEAIGEFMKKMNKEMTSRETSFVAKEIDGGGEVAWAQWTAKTPNGNIEGCGLYRVKNGMMTYYKDYMNATKES